MKNFPLPVGSGRGRLNRSEKDPLAPIGPPGEAQAEAKEQKPPGPERPKRSFDFPSCRRGDAGPGWGCRLLNPGRKNWCRIGGFRRSDKAARRRTPGKGRRHDCRPGGRRDGRRRLDGDGPRGGRDRPGDQEERLGQEKEKYQDGHDRRRRPEDRVPEDRPIPANLVWGKGQFSGRRGTRGVLQQGTHSPYFIEIAATIRAFLKVMAKALCTPGRKGATFPCGNFLRRGVGGDKTLILLHPILPPAHRNGKTQK